MPIKKAELCPGVIARFNQNLFTFVHKFSHANQSGFLTHTAATSDHLAWGQMAEWTEADLRKLFIGEFYCFNFNVTALRSITAKPGLVIGLTDNV